MADDDAPGTSPIWTPGVPLKLAEFIKRSMCTIHCYTQDMEVLGHVVSEKKNFLCLSHCKYMGANDPRGGGIFGPRCMIRRIYVKLHITILHTKYRSFGSCGFREEDFFMYFPFSLWQLMTPLGQGLYGSKGHSWQDL